MLDWYFSDYPQETVGWLLYSGAVVPLDNEAGEMYGKFEVSEEQVVKVLDELAIVPDDIFAIYHSHPMRTAEASEDDRQFMAELHEIWPGKVHIILDSNGYRVWVYDGDEIQEIAIA